MVQLPLTELDEEDLLLDTPTELELDGTDELLLEDFDELLGATDELLPPVQEPISVHASFHAVPVPGA